VSRPKASEHEQLRTVNVFDDDDLMDEQSEDYHDNHASGSNMALSL